MRSDDQPESIRKRLEIYEKTTQPLLKVLREEGQIENFGCIASRSRSSQRSGADLRNEVDNRGETSRIELKSPREIDLLRQAGHVSADILMALKKKSESGRTTRDIDEMAAKMMKEAGAKPSFLNYRGYPAVVCTSVNDEIVHAIPGSRKLKDGDLLSLDIGMFIEGYCGDTATSWVIGGKATPAQEKLMKAGRESLQASIDAALFGNRLGDVSYAMQSVVEEAVLMS